MPINVFQSCLRSTGSCSLILPPRISEHLFWYASEVSSIFWCYILDDIPRGIAYLSLRGVPRAVRASFPHSQQHFTFLYSWQGFLVHTPSAVGFQDLVTSKVEIWIISISLHVISIGRWWKELLSISLLTVTNYV